ncbi:MAG: hypothetical protein ACR2PS_13520, partial [Pseudomonadales bacterium]
MGAVGASICLLHPRMVHAHAFGARYDLPLPLGFFLIGAAFVVFLTFVASILLLGPRHIDGRYGHYDFLLSPRLFAWSRSTLRWCFGAVGVTLFFIILATALFGVDSPTRNFAPTFVWVIWWVGFAYVAQLFVNLWPWVNPWRWLGAAIDHLRGPRESTAVSVYACSLGHWPAVALFFVFAWVELISGAGEHPKTLATLILAYTALSCVGVWFTGAHHWLAHGEVFSVAFGIFGRFAPIAPREEGIRLRLFGHGLLTETVASPALMVFVVLMLSTVTFDGFLETPAWAGILEWVAADLTVRPVLLALKQSGADLPVVIKTAALAIFPLLCLGAYMFFCRLMSSMTDGGHRTLFIACAFVSSLIPIAIAYHFAHYYSFLLLAGQLIIPLLSDPFGAGWNVFGTAHRAIDITVIN